MTLKSSEVSNNSKNHPSTFENNTDLPFALSVGIRLLHWHITTLVAAEKDDIIIFVFL